MRSLVLALLSYLTPVFSAAQQTVQTPDEIYEELFVDVQLSKIFSDSKTFVDCIPKKDPKQILTEYRKIKSNPAIRFDLRTFIEANFIMPGAASDTSKTKHKNVVAHIEELWEALQRKKDTIIEGSSLIPLPHPYIIPGGRFREIYYWDSYFTMLGLKVSKRYDLIENMVKNFAYLIDEYGHIPNGNRSYYLSRSQPPFFSLMVELLASVKGEKVYLQFASVLEKEWKYWNDGRGLDIGFNNSKTSLNFLDANKKQVQVNRYWDDLSIPRQESYLEDIETASHFSNKFKVGLNDSLIRELYKNLRSAAASGWDFSSRWFRQPNDLSSIQTLNIAAVDLNGLLYHIQTSLFQVEKVKRKEKIIRAPAVEVERMMNLYSEAVYKQNSVKKFRKLFFNEKLGWYCDYNIKSKQVMDNPTLAGMFPLFFKLADKKDLPRIVEFLKKNFLKDGGLVTSLHTTGQQWDAPNGWPPLQWIAIVGLENYGYHELAKEIARRWVTLNKKVFKDTGKLMEKYDVVNTNLAAGGGEYPAQDGFGWTNGVLLALIEKYGLKD